MKDIKTSKPTKQRKQVFQAPIFIRHRYFAAPLSPELKKTHSLGAVPVRTGDTVRVMRGDRKGFEGKVTGVDKKNYRIFVEGLSREKVDGTTIFLPVHPSKVMVTGLNLDDKWRKESIKKKSETKKQLIKEQSALKPSKRTVEKPAEPEARVEEKEATIEEKPKEKGVRRKRAKPKKSAASKKTKEAEGES